MDDDVGFLYKTMIERDPNKRRVKPVESAAASLIDFDLGESSDDSDFRIEDHCEESDDSVDSNGDGKDNDDDSSSDSDSSEPDPVLGKKNAATTSVADLLEKARQQAEKGEPLDDKLTKMLICCGCLGDRSDDVNEIVECDGCGVTVHEGCYGVSDVESFSSTDSLSQSAPWFCEACSAGVEDPDCELCPNKGGIFKETDVGKWVHLVCALYVPGVAFGEVDKLTSVTLFEMQYSKYGAKPCFLCEDIRYARTGVCIECDAGMCHTYFHVTCAQREGLLSEAHHEEADQADPFYAHCKLHSDKTLVRKRKRNWLTLQLRASYRQEMLKKPEYRETEEFKRIQRKLTKHRQKYLAHKATKPPPWVPTQKMPRMLTTSASAIRALTHKADLMGIDAMALEAQEEQIASLVDIRKKWHIPPAFTVEFISYYLDRNVRITTMKRQLDELLQANTNLLVEQQELDKKYDEAIKINEDHMKVFAEVKSKIEMYHRVLKAINYTKSLPTVEDMARPKIQHNSGPVHSTPTAMVVKAEIITSQSPNKSNDSIKIAGNQVPDQNHKNPLPMRHQCGICRRSTDQHLLAKCDTCQLHYHLGCLTPPLARMPKKTKLMGWQCSECDKESSDSDPEIVDTSAPRRLRHCKEEPREPPPLPSVPPPLHPPPPPPPPPSTTTSCATTIVEEAIVHKPPSTKASPKKYQQKSHMVNNHNDNSVTTNSHVPHAPKFTFKTMEPQEKVQVATKVDEYNFNNHVDNNSIVPLRESPLFSLAPLEDSTDRNSSGRGKKRRREKHKRYSPDPITGEKQKKRKHKRKSIDLENPQNHGSGEVRGRILLKIKPIPMPEGEVASESNPQLFVASSTTTEFTPPKLPLQHQSKFQNLYKPTLAPTVPVSLLSHTPPSNLLPNSNSTFITPLAPAESNVTRRLSSGGRKPKDADLVADCTVCKTIGTFQNSVMCDECKRSYHFTCLDPPVKKSPKRRGYSWHCADCDPSEPETEN